jgi:cytoskeletal protein CcmA (bactofilin family)
VAGRLEGKIVVAGSVKVGQGGEVEGDIEARDVLVAGNVRGEIRSSDRAELSATAVVAGTIQSPKIVIAEGAQLTGNVAMKSSKE